MKVFFEKTILPCVADEIITWHIAHGWVWNVSADGVYYGVIFCTLLCGDGVIIHFTPKPGVTIPFSVSLAAFKKVVKITTPLGVVFATIPRSKSKLIQILKRLGFSETTGGFIREGEGEVALLKYLQNQNAILC